MLRIVVTRPWVIRSLLMLRRVVPVSHPIIEVNVSYGLSLGPASMNLTVVDHAAQTPLPVCENCFPFITREWISDHSQF